jgi:hypothetical protein
MTFASLSYPTSLRGVGVGLNQTLMRSSSTLSLFLFPLLVASWIPRVLDYRRRAAYRPAVAARDPLGTVGL